MADAPARKNLHGARNITLAEAAEWYAVSQKTLRRRIAEGRLRAYRIGPRAIRVNVEDLERMARIIPTSDPAA